MGHNLPHCSINDRIETMDKDQIESEVRQRIIQGLLSLTIPPNWDSSTTLRYIINYVDRSGNDKNS